MPKTGGLAVIDFCSRAGIPVLYGRAKRDSTAVVGKHLTARDWQHEDSQKFAIVRDPLTRLVSWFRFLSGLGAYQCSWHDFLCGCIEPSAVGFKTPSPWQPQTHWIGTESERSNIRLFAFESMHRTLPRYFGVETQLQALNVTNHDCQDLTAWYDCAQRRKVHTLFESDFVAWHAVSRK